MSYISHVLADTSESESSDGACMDDICLFSRFLNANGFNFVTEAAVLEISL